MSDLPTSMFTFLIVIHSCSSVVSASHLNSPSLMLVNQLQQIPFFVFAELTLWLSFIFPPHLSFL